MNSVVEGRYQNRGFLKFTVFFIINIIETIAVVIKTIVMMTVDSN